MAQPLLKKDDDQDDEVEYSPFYGIEKGAVLQEARVFNDPQLDPRRCSQVITKLLYLLNQGDTFTQREATEVIFAVTKLLQSRDMGLRRMVYLIMKELSPSSNEVIIVTSSLLKDINRKTDMYRANAIRVLCRITDGTLLTQIERYLKQAIVDKNPVVASAALIGGIHLLQTNPEIVERWSNEVQEAVQFRAALVQFHALALLHQIRQNDRLAVSKLVTSLTRGTVRSPLAQCLLVRYTSQVIRESAGNTQPGERPFYDYLESCLRNKAEMVILEAARAITELNGVTNRELTPAITVLQLFLCSSKPVLRFAAVRTLNKVVPHFQRSWSCDLSFNLSSFWKFQWQSCCMAVESQIGISNGNCNGYEQPSAHRTYQVVVAATRAMGIGQNGKLPWKLPSDLKFFKNLTLTTVNTEKMNAIIMGRKTWESIPCENRPLFGRLNVVLTRSGSFGTTTTENVIKCGSLSSALELLASSPYHSSIEKVFVIGGGEIFREALNGPGCDAVHFTDVETSFECDTFMPKIDMSLFHPWYSSFPMAEKNIRYSFVTYARVRCSQVESPSQNDKLLFNGRNGSVKFEVNDFCFLPKMVFERHEEYMYLRLVEDILSDGTSKNDRTCTGTVSKFGCQMRFNLRKTFPLLTTKRVFWRGVVEELLWFISGSTNAKILQDKGVHIWDGNASRDYLDGIGLKDREEGDLGPVYGFQWRHFGARYTDMHADYTGQGFDQLMDVINKIKNNPDDRRIILSAWNPSDLKLMALPPCHMFAQFYVSNGELSCQMYQRSADMGLGVPFNIASYSLLTCMIAHVCGLSPGDFIHVIGDAHVYSTHIQPLQEQLRKVPKPFPVLKINPEKKDIDSFVGADIKLIGYEPHEKIEMKMAI